MIYFNMKYVNNGFLIIKVIGGILAILGLLLIIKDASAPAQYYNMRGPNNQVPVGGRRR